MRHPVTVLRRRPRTRRERAAAWLHAVRHDARRRWKRLRSRVPHAA